jgi:hypothetical protein
VVGSHGVSNNVLHIDHLHTNAVGGTLWQLGKAFSANWIHLGQVEIDQGATGVTGIVVAGATNYVRLSASGAGLVNNTVVELAPTADSNTIDLLMDGERADALVTDHSALPTNRVRWSGTPPAVRTIRAKAGSAAVVHTQRLFAATVLPMISPVPISPRPLRC